MFTLGAPRMNSISSQELQKRMESGEKPTIIDVREPWEWEEGHIPNSFMKPLGEIKVWSSDLKKDDEIVLVCRSGARSSSAYQYLAKMGFKNLVNMSGGIITWRGSVER